MMPHKLLPSVSVDLAALGVPAGRTLPEGTRIGSLERDGFLPPSWEATIWQVAQGVKHGMDAQFRLTVEDALVARLVRRELFFTKRGAQKWLQRQLQQSLPGRPSRQLFLPPQS